MVVGLTKNLPAITGNCCREVCYLMLLFYYLLRPPLDELRLLLELLRAGVELLLEGVLLAGLAVLLGGVLLAGVVVLRGGVVLAGLVVVRDGCLLGGGV